MTHAIAKEGSIQVRWIDKRFQPAFLTIGQNFTPPNTQKGSRQWDGLAPIVWDRPGDHPFQTCQAGTAQQVHQYGFHLIVSCVSHSHSLRAGVLRLLEQKTRASEARRLLNR